MLSCMFWNELVKDELYKLALLNIQTCGCWFSVLKVKKAYTQKDNSLSAKTKHHKICFHDNKNRFKTLTNENV